MVSSLHNTSVSKSPLKRLRLASHANRASVTPCVSWPRLVRVQTVRRMGKDMVQVRASELFKGRHFDREIIVLCMRCYLRYKLSSRDPVQMMAELLVNRGCTIQSKCMRSAPAAASPLASSAVGAAPRQRGPHASAPPERDPRAVFGAEGRERTDGLAVGTRRVLGLRR